MHQRYTRMAMWRHWLIAILLMSQFAFGWYLNDIPRGVPVRGYFVNLHKSSGCDSNWCAEFRGLVPRKRHPIGMPFAVGPVYPQGQHMFSVWYEPPAAREFQPLLHYVAVRALDLARANG